MHNITMIYMYNILKMSVIYDLHVVNLYRCTCIHVFKILNLHVHVYFSAMDRLNGRKEIWRALQNFNNVEREWLTKSFKKVS